MKEHFIVAFAPLGVFISVEIVMAVQMQIFYCYEIVQSRKSNLFKAVPSYQLDGEVLALAERFVVMI